MLIGELNARSARRPRTFCLWFRLGRNPLPVHHAERHAVVTLEIADRLCRVPRRDIQLWPPRRGS